MKKFLTFWVIALLGYGTAFAQNALNKNADNILGHWIAVRGGENSKVLVSKNTDNSYNAQVYWVEVDKDKNGNKKLDSKNPDKKLRNIPCDRIVLIEGLKYNAEKEQWDGTEVYDPTMGIKARCVVRFENDGRLKITGTKLMISQSVYWTRIQE